MINTGVSTLLNLAMDKQIKIQGEQEQNSGYLPNFCDVKFILVLVLVSELLAIVLTLNAAQLDSNIWDHLAITSMFILWVALSSAALLCALRPYLNRFSNLATSIISYLLILLLTLSFSLITSYVTEFYELTIYYSKDWSNQFILKNLAIAAIIAGVILRYFFVQHQWKQNLALQSRAKFEALQARIRPHFLFNSMNTIASLIHDSPDKAETTIENLSDLFRASLRENSEHKLSDEIELTRSYLAIEQLRLGGRLQTKWDIEDIGVDPKIPSLCLQPLVENAIYHGIEPLHGGGVIQIHIYKHNKRIVITVINPVADSGPTFHHKGNQMAQENIRERLQLAFVNTTVFEIQKEPTLYKVTIEIPFKTEGE